MRCDGGQRGRRVLLGSVDGGGLTGEEDGTVISNGVTIEMSEATTRAHEDEDLDGRCAEGSEVGEVD